jgi:SAM-dependent methyltransferase
VYDASNGFEAIAPAYIAGRGTGGTVGASVVRAWAADLPRGAAALDLGCGPGVPITQALVDAELRVWAVDASPRMLAAFRARFPDVPAECATVEASRLFDRTFDAAVAWGLLFLLDEAAQALVIAKVAGALVRGGQLLFTAPAQACTWADAQTGRPSRSLGAARYAALLADAGLHLTGTAGDEGENHYYFARKP